MRWREWLVGWAALVVLAGGVAYVLTDEDSPVRPFKDPVVTETSIRDVVVMPIGQAEVTGTVSRVDATDANGPAIPTPLTVESGRATIEEAAVDGRPSTIVWDGGRPFALTGGAGIDPGPTHLVWTGGTVTWPLEDGVLVVLPGDYDLRTPVAVGAEGLAAPRDDVRFTAGEETTIETGGWTVAVPLPALHLEGPGGVVLEGDLTVKTREGTRHASRLALADGPYVVDVADGGVLTATVRGDLDVQ